MLSPTKPDDDVASNFSTKTIIQLTKENGQSKNILGLLDTSAIGKVGAFIKCDTLNSILHEIEQVDGQIQGRYATEMAKEVVTFDIKLPEI
eukprot:7994209-Ditylum_brightwellii.AAC.1